MNEVDVAWVAGLLEGEGCFMLKSSGSHYPIITCEMTDKDVVAKLHDLIGGAFWYDGERKENWKPTWRITLQGQKAIALMKLILPHMGIRRSEKINKILNASEQHYADKLQKRIERDNLIEQAAQDYLDGNGSYRQLQKKYKLSRSTINKKVISLTS